ncbi:MAG: hypothetical protein MZU97_14095 [Bacillus subtilis]|nr:hypothetical protein [Bacillus subtilis]
MGIRYSGYSGGIAGATTAPCIWRHVFGGFLTGLGIGATIGFFVGGAIGYSKYSICKPGSIANPNGTGQVHHVFGKKHEKILNQKFGLNRNDYLVRANDLDAHFGYQTWHRIYNKKVLSLLKGSKTILELQRGVNAIYSTQLMIGKFGLTIISLIP